MHIGSEKTGLVLHCPTVHPLCFRLIISLSYNPSVKLVNIRKAVFLTLLSRNLINL